MSLGIHTCSWVKERNVCKASGRRDRFSPQKHSRPRSSHTAISCTLSVMFRCTWYPFAVASWCSKLTDDRPFGDWSKPSPCRLYAHTSCVVSWSIMSTFIWFTCSKIPSASEFDTKGSDQKSISDKLGMGQGCTTSIILVSTFLNYSNLMLVISTQPFWVGSIGFPLLLYLINYTLHCFENILTVSLSFQMK